MSAVENNDEAIIESYKLSGDRELRDKLIEKYTCLAHAISTQFKNKGIEYDDIYQVACIGLILAVERFDANKGAKFTTFATHTVKGEIKRYFRDRGYAIRIPRRLYDIYVRARQIRYEEGRTPTTEELSKILNADKDEIEKCLLWEREAHMESLDQKISATGKDELLSTLGAEDKAFLELEDRDFLERTLKLLDETEKKFIYLRYCKRKTQAEIAKHMNITQMTVSRLEKKLLQKMKQLYFK